MLLSKRLNKSPKKRSTILLTSIVVVAITLCGKLLGFVREAFVASCYGASYISDVYVLESGIVNAVCTILLCVVTTAFIPLYMSKENKKKATHFACNALYGFFFVGALLSFALCLVPEAILQFVAPGFLVKYSGEQLVIILLSIQISMMNVLLLLLQGLFRALMQTHDKMFIAAGQAIVFNILIIIYLIFLSKYGLLGITIAMLIAQAAIALVFFTRVVVSGMLVLEKTTVESIKSDFKEMFSLALPVVFMSILSQASYIVDRSVASNFDEGTMALIGYASTLALAVHALFSESINNVVYPKLSSYAAKSDSSGFLELANSSIFLACLLIAPLLITMFCGAQAIIEIVYYRGNFTYENVQAATVFLMLYLPGVFFFYLRDLLNRFCYAQKNSKLPSICAVIGFILTIILNLTIPHFCGAMGIVIATSLAAIIACILEAIVIYKERLLVWSKSSFKLFGLVGLALVISFMSALGVSIASAGMYPIVKIILMLVVSYMSYCAIAVLMGRSFFAPVLGRLSK